LTLSMTRGWNTVFVPTNDNITRDSIENFCGSVKIFSIEGSRLIIQKSLTGGDAYLVRTSKDCTVQLHETRYPQSDIMIRKGWNVIGTSSELDYSDVIDYCGGNIQMLAVNHGRLIPVKYGDKLRKDNAYLVKSSDGCALNI
ncbi:MAG: hypothetical protein JW716_06025, partial [Candidatus Aenigmarchaeota archaeon]|nr:hypothetical protein [Candidatus Aenigmarchaeota archaeon]